MLMAAGLGTRLRPFTDVEPKALLPLMGVPMAQFAIDALSGSGVRRIVANIHHHAERARATFQTLDLGGAELILSDESDVLLGSAGGIRKASPHFEGDPFFLLNADVLCEVDLSSLARAHARNRERFGAKLTLTIFPAGPKGGSYREILFDPSAGKVTGFVNKLVEGRPYFAGAAVLDSEALEHVPAAGPAEFIPTILEPALREGKVGCYLADGIWHDVGNPMLWLNAHLGLIRALEQKALPLWSERIGAMNKRVAPELWVGKGAGKDASVATRLAHWQGPAYWNPLRDEAAVKPERFGPDVVLYGAAPSQVELTRGIGFGGHWVPTKD